MIGLQKEKFVELKGLCQAIKGTIDTESGIVDKILTESLYDNVIGSPPREILMNAIDAMYQAGKGGQPVVIKFPNELDQDFYIKDSGVGLTHDEVVYLFQTLGASKKRRTGENAEMAMKHLTGEFGLGSKAFFAYTDAGWVIAAKDGMQETFFLSYDGNGNRICLPVENSRIPAPADWQNGVCVGYAIKPEDNHRFFKEVCEVLRWVNYPVTVLGVSENDLSLAKPEPQAEGEGWSMYNSDEVRMHYIRMGRIVYPLNTSRLGEIKDSWRAFLNTKKLVLDVQNKAVDVVANREALKYSERTIAHLTERLDFVAQSIAMELLEKVQSAITGKWDEKKAVHQTIKESYPWLGHRSYDEAIVKLMGLSDDDTATVLQLMREEGQTLPTWVGNSDWTQPGAPVLATYYTMQEAARKGLPARLKKYDIRKGGVVLSSSSGYSNLFLSYGKDLVCVVVDGPVAREKIRELLTKKPATVVVAFHFASSKTKDYSLLEQAANRLKQEMGGWTVQKVSQMEVPESVKRIRELQKERRTQGFAAMASEEIRLFSFAPGNLTPVLETKHAQTFINMVQGYVDADGEEVEASIDAEDVSVACAWLGRDTVHLPLSDLVYPENVGEDNTLQMGMHTFFDGIEFVRKNFPESTEPLKYLLFLPPKVMKSKKWRAANNFKTVFEVLNECINPVEAAERLKRESQGIPEVLPLSEKDDVKIGYWDKHPIRMTMDAHKDTYFQILKNKARLADAMKDREEAAYYQTQLVKSTERLAQLEKALDIYAGMENAQTIPALLKSAYPQSLEELELFNEQLSRIDSFKAELTRFRVNAQMYDTCKGLEIYQSLVDCQVPSRAIEVLREVAHRLPDETFSQVQEYFGNGKFIEAARLHRRLYEVWQAEVRAIEAEEKSQAKGDAGQVEPTPVELKVA